MADCKALLTGDTVGGVWTFTLELAEGLIARGIDVCLATFGKKGTAAQQSEAGAIPGLQWLDSAYKLEWMEEPWDDAKQSASWVLEVARRFRPDVVHLNSLLHADLPWNAPVVMTVHSCVPSWWAAVKREPLPQNWDRYLCEVTRSLRAANLVTAPSQTMLDAACQLYGIEEGRVIYNGRRPDRFWQAAKQPLVLAAGRLWDEGKNICALAAIASKLPWPVFLAGEGGNVPGCSMLGRLSQEELSSWYAMASIYALPALYEPFGLSALEAALSGCALVLGDLPSLREIWGDAAVYASCGDLEQAVLGLISDTGRRSEMAERARTRALNFTQDRMVDGYLQAYDMVRSRRMACAS